MKSYIGAKIIKAAPMSLAEFNHDKVQEGKEPLKPSTKEEEGYEVVYPDGYTSWSPKAVFEESYRPVNSSEAELISGGTE